MPEIERLTYDEDTPKSKLRKIEDDEDISNSKHRETTISLGSKPISFRTFLASAYQFYEEEKLIKLESVQPQTCIGALTEGSKKKQSAQGDKLMLKLKMLLDYIPKTYKNWERSKMQKIFHRNFMQATCMHLYRHDPDIDIDNIMKMNNFTNLKQQVLCLTPRRFGKSTSVAMFVASYVLTVPYSEQCIFSTGRRASQKLLELIRDMIKAGKYKDMFVKCNGETMLVQGPDPLDVRKVHSYPSCAKTLRGCGGDVVYMEEAAFMALDVFFEVIVPLLEMDTTALIAISTPLDGMNFYSEMFELKGGDGKPLFNQLRIGMSCKKCQDAGKAADCTHMASVVPPWKSAAKFDMVKAIYGDRKDILARESMGQITNDAASIFSQGMVEKLLAKQPWVLKSGAKYVFLGVDPNGGGDSQMAIVTMVMEMNNIIFCGFETHGTKNHDQIQHMLLGHIRMIRAHPDLRDAWIINFFESNLGLEAAHMAHMCRNERRCYTQYEKGKCGVLTTHARKEAYTHSFLNYFNTEAVHFINDWICCNPFEDANTRHKKVKAELKKQMLSFQKMVLSNDNRPFEVAKHIYSGKVKAGMNDDIVMTILFTTYWAIEFVAKRLEAPYESFEAC